MPAKRTPFIIDARIAYAKRCDVNGEDKMARKRLQKEDLITIDGYVVTVELEDGDTGFVVDDGEEEYFVVLDKKGNMLSNHVDEEVEVSGTLSRKDGKLWLKVSEFQLIDYYDDRDEYDDYLEGYDDR